MGIRFGCRGRGKMITSKIRIWCCLGHGITHRLNNKQYLSPLVRWPTRQFSAALLLLPIPPRIDSEIHICNALLVGGYRLSLCLSLCVCLSLSFSLPHPPLHVCVEITSSFHHVCHPPFLSFTGFGDRTRVFLLAHWLSRLPHFRHRHLSRGAGWGNCFARALDLVHRQTLGGKGDHSPALLIVLFEEAVCRLTYCLSAWDDTANTEKQRSRFSRTCPACGETTRNLKKSGLFHVFPSFSSPWLVGFSQHYSILLPF